MRKKSYIEQLIVIISLAGFVALGVLGVVHRSDLRNQLIDDTKYLPEIKRVASEYNLDWRFVRALIFQESRFDSNAIGTAGEVGLMQVLPKGSVADWAREKRQPVPSTQSLKNPLLNLEIGCFYLAKAMNRWKDYRMQRELALCQYNAGASRAKAWAPQNKDGDMIENIDISSTKSYVKNIMARYWKYCSQNEEKDE